MPLRDACIHPPEPTSARLTSPTPLTSAEPSVFSMTSGATATPPDIQTDGRDRGLVGRLALRPAALREDVSQWFQGLSRAGATAIAIGLMLCVAVGDDLTGADVSFTLLYLGPIGF